MNQYCDVVRDILLYIEQNATPLKPISINKLSCDLNYDEQTIAYVSIDLRNEEFINAFIDHSDGFEIVVGNYKSLTSKGTDFLNAIRDNSKWVQIKDATKTFGVPLTIKLIEKTVFGLFSSSI